MVQPDPLRATKHHKDQPYALSSELTLRTPAGRVQAILTIDRQPALAELDSLIAEVLDLVEQHRPEIDTSRTRMIQRMPARPCTAKPPFPLM